jgi:hypothetical protein
MAKTAERGSAGPSRMGAGLWAVAAGLMLAVILPASPAHAFDDNEKKAAAAVAQSRCAKMQAQNDIPRRYKEDCEAKLTDDLLSGRAGDAAWAHALCKWVPDLPLIGNPCDQIAALMKGAYDEFQTQVKNLRDTAAAIANPVDAALKNVATSLGDALKSLLRKVLTELVHVTSPNVASAGFRSTYAAGAGIGMFVLVLMVARVFYRASAGELAGEELAESLWRWVPTAVLLVLFGPALGYLFVGLTDAASVSILEYFSVDIASLSAKLEAMVVLSNVGLVPGGPLVAIAIMLLAFLGVLGLLGGLLVQLLAQYLMGSVMAIAFVMLIDPATRPKAAKLPMTWVGLGLAKALLFFLIGALARIADSAFSASAIADDGMRALVTALVAALGLVIVGVAPWSLLKFAPVLSGGAGHRMGKASRGASTGAVGGMATSTMTQMAFRRMQSGPGGGSQSAAGGGGGTSGDGQGQDAASDLGSASGSGRSGAGTASPSGDGLKAGSAAAESSPATAAGTGAGTAGAGAAGGGGSGAAGGAAGAAAAGATAATGGAAAVALIGIQGADAAKRKTEDVAHRASDVAPGE